MATDDSPNDLYALRRAVDVGLDWTLVHRRAVAEGRGVTLCPEEERLAAVDELLAGSLQELLVLGELAAYASIAALADECRRPIARISAALVRLLDRALLAHARDIGYRAAIWQQDIAVLADVVATALAEPHLDAHPLPDTLRRSAALIGEALAALPRDRLGVPGLLTRATAELLVVYAAASAT